LPIHARAGEQASHDGVFPGSAASLVGEFCAAAAVDLVLSSAAGGTGSEGIGKAVGEDGAATERTWPATGGVSAAFDLGVWVSSGRGRGKWWVRVQFGFVLFNPGS
jgi:hypothetical protein